MLLFHLFTFSTHELWVYMKFTIWWMILTNSPTFLDLDLHSNYDCSHRELIEHPAVHDYSTLTYCSVFLYCPHGDTEGVWDFGSHSTKLKSYSDVAGGGAVINFQIFSFEMASLYYLPKLAYHSCVAGCYMLANVQNKSTVIKYYIDNFFRYCGSMFDLLLYLCTYYIYYLYWFSFQ